MDTDKDVRASLRACEVKRKAVFLERWAYRIEALLEEAEVRDALSLEDVASVRASLGAVALVAERVRGILGREMIAAGIKPEGVSPDRVAMLAEE